VCSASTAKGGGRTLPKSGDMKGQPVPLGEGGGGGQGRDSQKKKVCFSEGDCVERKGDGGQRATSVKGGKKDLPQEGKGEEGGFVALRLCSNLTGKKNKPHRDRGGKRSEQGRTR